ncbi:transmembrane protein 196-like [Littorina saxatilis]|uniref:Transmembrane protein 196 n=1 Tax=Littorina saxatilis TaxID=31220 RepID=A0AAN9BE02_9CAEN
MMQKPVVLAVYVVSGVHAFLGVLNLVVGVIASIRAEVWRAHSVSPIWSGGFFLISGMLGALCARRMSSYVIMCFTAFSVVSLVTAVVSIQLLRLGMVNHTTDGHTFQKEQQDPLIYVALSVAGLEILVCLISVLLSCRIAKVAKEEMCKQRDGMFHVKENFDEITETSSVDGRDHQNHPDEEGHNNGNDSSPEDLPTPIYIHLQPDQEHMYYTPPADTVTTPEADAGESPLDILTPRAIFLEDGMEFTRPYRRTPCTLLSLADLDHSALQRSPSLPVVRS